MAGKNPREAVYNFFEPLQAVLSCFSSTTHLVHRGPYTVGSGPYALFIERFRLPGSDLYLDARMQYRIVKAEGERGPFKVTTTAYTYILNDEDEKELFAYQWHPDLKIKFPHLHLGSSTKIANKTLKKIHLPTGRIALEQVLRLAVEELEVEPLNDQWDSILSDAQRRFERWRTWP